MPNGKKHRTRKHKLRISKKTVLRRKSKNRNDTTSYMQPQMPRTNGAVLKVKVRKKR